MAGITLAEAEEHLATWLRAESKIALGQSVSHAGQGTSRGLTRADLASVGQRIKYWQGEVARLSAQSGATGPRVQEVVIRG